MTFSRPGLTTHCSGASLTTQSDESMVGGPDEVDVKVSNCLALSRMYYFSRMCARSDYPVSIQPSLAKIEGCLVCVSNRTS
jgi:hypothetical protein